MTHINQIIEAVLVSVANQIDAAMRARRMSQLRLAMRTGRVHHNTVNRAVRARNLQLSTLVDLADGLDHDVEIKLIPRHPAPPNGDTNGADG